ncbi:MAG TPA: ComEC/Rec2 family competence protein [Rickettsiales bacterium]|nr:ComEC/Rec2 family competence protein [Rickettsiales bacterium]
MKNIFEKINNFINQSFFDDYHNWILWCPVFFALGILSYFKFEYINLSIFLILSLSIIFLFIIFRKQQELIIFLYAISLIFVGYVRTCYYVKSLESPTVKYRMGLVKVYGLVNDVSYYQRDGETRKRIIVEIDKIEKVKKLEKDQRVRNDLTSYFTVDGIKQNPPKYIRININDVNTKLNFGDYVEVKANLIPTPKQVFPGAYNLQREFYFQQIGGIAYNGVVENVESIKAKTIYEKFRNKMYNVRENINNRMIDAIGKENGTLVGSFITGIRGKISSQDYADLTYAGLVHLIAISGLNMAIIMGLAFWIIRRILVQFEYLALNFDIKKISAVFAIIVGFLYLSITGFPVSANRAYIMALLYFIGILIDREIDSMRFLSLAGILILFFEPNLVLSPAFQLSFFAVIGLICGFKFLKDIGIKTYTTNNWLKPLYYIFATFVSSIIATISVSPLVVYHFNNFTPYNTLANIFAIPLVSLITLPFATISILLFPFNLEKFLLIPAGWSIGEVLKISKYVVNLPNSVFILQSPSLISLTLIILGFLWFMLWEQKWRYFGVFLFCIGIAIIPIKDKPNVIIDKEDKFIILIDDKGKLYISDTKNDYKISVITKKLGQENYKKLSEYDSKNISEFEKNLNNVFKNKDIVKNFRELNIQYNVFDKDYKILVLKLPNHYKQSMKLFPNFR